MATNDSPTESQKAAFYLKNSMSLVGAMDTLETAVGATPHVPRGAGVETAEDAYNNLAIAFHEGVRKSMQNRRETGHSPISAFRATIRDEWPEWVVVAIAESEYETFAHGDPDFMSDAEKEYVSFLEEEYGVPQ